MAKKQATRQSIRRALLFISFLLFPVTINYFSPYIIVDGASERIINGSFIVFGLLLISALIVGRLWCGWMCPAGGMQEFCFAINNNRAKGGWLDWIKWIVVWIPWIGVIIYVAASAGGYRAIDFFYMNENVVSTDAPERFIIYYIVVGVFAILALAFGRRASCHYICWMAPFMIIGRAIRNLVKWPSLRLKADAEKCGDCKRCTNECPMSLDVNGAVQKESMENAECILCGTCVDICPKGAIHYSFSGGK